MSVFKLLLALTLVGVTLAAPSRPVAHEKRDSTPVGFAALGPAHSDTTLKLRFALAQADSSSLVDALYAVSDPASPQYGEHLTKAQVEAFVAPKNETTEAVNAWLTASGLAATSISPTGDWVSVDIPVSKANQLLNADFTVFTNEATGKQAVRTMSYSLPDELRGHVDLIHPTVVFPIAKTIDPSVKSAARRRTFHTPVPRQFTPSCDDDNFPSCLQALYNIPLTPAVNKDLFLGVTGFYGNSAHYEYLNEFLVQFRPDMDPNTNFTSVGIDGGENTQTGPSASEGELDIQYTVGLATGVPVVYYFIGFDYQDGPLEGFLDEANYLLSLDHPPQVLSTSYGMQESSLTPELTDKLCQVYAQLGARGVSIVYASGDSGVGCSDTDAFAPTFPSNCPYVTSVGGTQNGAAAPEDAWVGSGGGFSNYYPRPAYQDAAVSAYLASPNPNAGRFNASGRGFPDIAAKADFYLIEAAGLFAVQGTSASTPVVASVVALLNDRLASAGRPPLGFLNPWLYGEARGAFRTSSRATARSSARTTPIRTVPQGFDAVVGWDPVTGLGSPDFNKLLAVLGL
ncbi:subtilisin-like protein [Epithele typhae]|uniref:subtilisin-like protein n=1 Tax=Epithele typhae TaxID=378194 RepID=UPI0020080B9A|nr:subtilisin-like protein [Epithele typhae]KAH9919439.1 subtilisin-like protein [Epithele typhae]